MPEPRTTPTKGARGAGDTSGSQTLSRGLTALALLADHGSQTIQSLADLLGVHRSVAYRLVRTLEEHRLVVRAGGRLAHLYFDVLRLHERHAGGAVVMPRRRRCGRFRGGLLFLCGRIADMETEHQAAARGGADLEEVAPRQIGCCSRFRCAGHGKSS